MHVFITGATGFVGRALVLRLLRDGHEITAMSRSRVRAHERLGPHAHVVSPNDAEALRAALEKSDAVVHLAGENVLGGRWTSRRKQRLVDSRVALTRGLFEALATCRTRPSVLLSANAVGIYGDRGDEPLTEASPTGDGFLADLCIAWEREAQRATELGLRVATFRIGIVLGTEGGALASTLPSFELGLGARLGDGRQYWSFIHVADLAELIVTALEDERFSGTFNATAPEPVDNRTFTAALADALGRRARLAVPRPMLRLGLGEASTVLTQSQRAVPERAQQLGFQFRHPALAGALNDLLGPRDDVVIEQAPSIPMGVGGRRPHYRLSHRTTIPAPLPEVFELFSKPRNLGLLTPTWTRLRILGEPPEETYEGLEIDYRIALGPVPVKWKTRITAWEPGARFVDEQLRGPYALWHHEHRFEADGERTIMEDVVHYRVPFGALGRLAHPVLVGPALRRIFAYRSEAIALRFGTGEGDRLDRAA